MAQLGQAPFFETKEDEKEFNYYFNDLLSKHKKKFGVEPLVSKYDSLEAYTEEIEEAIEENEPFILYGTIEDTEAVNRGDVLL